MKVDVVASEPHYLRHLMPIWAALPPELQGTVHPLYEPGFASRPPMGRVALVAGWQDVAPLRGQCNMIYVEHGAGQTYADAPHDPSYSGSAGQRHRGVIGYVCPSEQVAVRWSKPAVAVGCPKMDRLLSAPRRLAGITPAVCFAWHWDCQLVPEARSAWAHFEHRFPEIVAHFQSQGFSVLVHGHPKWRGALDAEFAKSGAIIARTEDEVFEHADVLVVDNSSLAMEFMSLGRPVVWLNAPWYRRDVQHGGRFWDWTVGHPSADDPDALLRFNMWDQVYLTAERRAEIEATADTVYAHRDGRSSERAAAFIAELVREL